MSSNISSHMNSTTSGAYPSHISFEEMANYLFSDGRDKDFLATAARINKHVMECEDCRKLYSTVIALRDEADAFARHENLAERTILRIISYFYSMSIQKPIKTLLDECKRFKLLLSFNIKNLRELAETTASGFSYPKLVTVMKSSTDENKVEESESVIYSSLIDQNKNRVSIGLDGTLTMYFDNKEHSVGKRVMVIPDDETMQLQMIELRPYDRSLSYVRFEGVTPGSYTIVVEE